MEQAIRRHRAVGVILAAVGAVAVLALVAGLVLVPAGEAQAAGKGRMAAAKVVKKQSMAGASLALSTSSYTYDGKAKKPTVTVRLGGKRLVRGTHFTVSYKNNTKAGTATAIVKGKGAYTGTRSKAFKIARRSLAKASVSLSKASYTYDGREKRPTAAVRLSGKRLTRNSHFTVAYRSNVNAGTATVTVSGTGNYCGSVAKRFAIAPRSLKSASVTPASASLPYSGRPQSPAVTAKLSGRVLRNGIDYTVSYRANTAIGTATAVIAGKGNYTGTASKAFKITEPLVGQRLGTAYAAGQGAAYRTIPAAERNAGRLSLTAAADKSCVLAIEGRRFPGRWKLDTFSNDDNRYYVLAFDDGQKWGAFYTRGTVRLVDLKDSTHGAIFG